MGQLIALAVASAGFLLSILAVAAIHPILLAPLF